jgi:hypothetical protein
VTRAHVLRQAEGLGALVTACGGSDSAFKLMMLDHIDGAPRCRRSTARV